MSTTEDVITSYRRGFIAGSAHRSGDVQQLVSGRYDAVIVTSSWDARCVSLATSSPVTAEMGIALLFDTRDKLGLRDAHDPIIEKFVRTCASSFEIITGDSCDVSGIWTQLSFHLNTLRQKQGRPLRILLDLSACPRYYALGTIAVAFVRRVASFVKIFYAEGVYEPERVKGDLAFTGGRWSTVAVPYLAGLFEPAKGRHYLVSAGFEGEKTYRAVSRADPDRVSILFSKPGISPEYEERAVAANALLTRDFLIRRPQVLNAPASDAIAAWRSVTVWGKGQTDQFNNYYLCCGTKPHAIGLGLSAIVSGATAVLYNVPEEHRVHQTRSNDVYWTYSIKDMTSLA